MNVPTRIAVRRLLTLTVGWLALSAAAIAPAADPSQKVEPDHAQKMAQGLALFKTKVRNILVTNCVHCHGGEETEGDFDLTTREGLLKGGFEGVAVIPGEAKQSRLYQLVAHLDEPTMPQEASKLPDTQIAALARWIDLEAPYDKPLLDQEEIVPWTERQVPPEARKYWAFQPLKRIEPPPVEHKQWAKTPLDAFVLAALEDQGLVPNDLASRRVLIRRAYFDLIGLPPTLEEIRDFQADKSADAYGNMIDRLLASPHYGERWARHWLDVARFAESHGFEQDYDRPHAYHYRDFVIRALNADMPYDRFVRWQLAGDEIAPDDPLAMMATGFLGAGVFPTQITANEVERTRYDALDDMAATTGAAFLGLSIGCARCHDHKFDPIPQADYYRFTSTFTTTVRSNIDLEVPHSEEIFQKRKARLEAELARYEKVELPRWLAHWEETKSDSHLSPKQASPPDTVVAVLEIPADQRSEKQQTELLAWYRTRDPGWILRKQRLDNHLKHRPSAGKQKVMVASDALALRKKGYKPIRHHTQGADYFTDFYYLKRGDSDQKVKKTSQAFLQVLTRASEGAEHWQSAPLKDMPYSGQRRALAEWITDTEYGAGHLVARVIVNRLWQHHFGRGIVATPNDFGHQGYPPTHPALLDYLATELIQEGWRLKPIHRLIMTSAAYRQSSAHDHAKASVDPENTWWWRYEPQRLEAEIIRDNLLAVSGVLDRRMFGPGTLTADHTRRSIYFMVKRSKLTPMMMLFDMPEPNVSQGRRATTTIAPQALLLMNSPVVRRCARTFARRLAFTADRSLEEAVREGYWSAVGRKPTGQEVATSLEFLKAQKKAYQADKKENASQLALVDFCQVLFGLNEFIYIK